MLIWDRASSYLSIKLDVLHILFYFYIAVKKKVEYEGEMGNQCLHLQKSREIHVRTVHGKAVSFSSLHHQINSLFNQPEKWVWNLYKVFLCYQNPLLFTIQRCLWTDLGFKTNKPELFRKGECRDSLTCAVRHVLCFISSDLCL